MKKKYFTLFYVLLAVTNVNAQIVKGDMNGDGKITMTDANEVVNVYLGNSETDILPVYDKEKVDTMFDNILDRLVIADKRLSVIESGNSGIDSDINESINKDSLLLPYKINGVTYHFVLVDGGSMPPFYMMQTELPPDAVFEINGKRFDPFDVHGDYIILDKEYGNFIYDVREKTGLDLRMPTIEEWLFAAKGGKYSKGYTYAGSNNIDEVAWYSGNAKFAQPVAQKKPNELGLYDMSGNYGELTYYTSSNIESVDGNIYGGYWNSPASSCLTTSWIENNKSAGRIRPGSYYRQEGACEGLNETFRLVYLPNLLSGTTWNVTQCSYDDGGEDPFFYNNDTIGFNQDGTVSFTFANSDWEGIKGKWTFTDSTLKIEFYSDDHMFLYTKGTLSIQGDSATYNFYYYDENLGWEPDEVSSTMKLGKK